MLGFRRLSSSANTNGQKGCGRRVVQRRTLRRATAAHAADGAASRCRAALLCLVAVARRRGDIACLKATCRQPALVPPNSYCRDGLPAHTLTPELSNTRSIVLLVRWTARGSIDATRGREGGRPAAAGTAVTDEVRRRSTTTRQRIDMRASGDLFDSCRIDRPSILSYQLRQLVWGRAQKHERCRDVCSSWW